MTKLQKWKMYYKVLHACMLIVGLAGGWFLAEIFKLGNYFEGIIFFLGFILAEGVIIRQMKSTGRIIKLLTMP